VAVVVQVAVVGLVGAVLRMLQVLVGCFCCGGGHRLALGARCHFATGSSTPAEVVGGQRRFGEQWLESVCHQV